MSKDIGFCSITEDLCKKDEKCEDCSLKHIHENIEHYAKLHEENRLIELPCKVGDTVYTISFTSETPWIVGTEYYDIFYDEFELCMLDDLGEWVFLTKEEAKAKLAELKGTENETREMA